MYRFILGALAVALSVILVGAGFVGGYLVAKHQTPAVSVTSTDKVPGNAEPTTGGTTGKPGPAALISEIMNGLATNYVEPVDLKKLQDGAIKGMIEALGDPYASYFDQSHYRFFREQTSGEFYGVGIQIGLKGKQVTVIAPIDGTPAAAAGIKAGDQIISVDGTATKGQSVEMVASRIRGEEGTTVKLVLMRAGEKKTRDYSLKRVKLSLPNVTAKIIEKTKTGYVRIHTFDGHVAQQVSEELKKLKAKGADSFVIDLRDNPGGLLQSGVDVSSLFIADGPIVTVKHRGGRKETLLATGGADADTPIIVLVNKGSASAAEIFAGAMQDRGRAKLVGEQTFGKAAVQTIVPVSGGGGLKVTSAFYLTPKGRNISKVGIAPDYRVKFVAGKGTAPDSQLQKALDLLR
jgi:carboxyl-terminal processing protease